MPRRIEDSVVVITGASSGIGRATARAFARRGASVVLAARREALLREVAEECERAGGRALAVPTDVTDEAAVEALARRAVEEFGRIDVWVNNAGVTLYARFDEAPPRTYDRVIETNLFGSIYGARAALRRFREQGSGVLVNNASVFASMGAPYASAYIASKHAVRALGECLRQELRDADDIHVSTILPASIDTPFFQHAANYTGRALKPLRPVIDVERVAEAIVGLAERPRRERVVGQSGRMLRLGRAAPWLQERMVARQVELDHFQDAPAPPTDGNVLEPMPAGAGASGGWQTDGRRSVNIRRLVLAGGAVGVLAGLWRRR